MPGIEDKSRFMTIQEVADMLHVHYQTILAWKRKGTLSFVRVGRRSLIERFDVEKMIKSGRITGPSWTGTRPVKK